MSNPSKSESYNFTSPSNAPLYIQFYIHISKFIKQKNFLHGSAIGSPPAAWSLTEWSLNSIFPFEITSLMKWRQISVLLKTWFFAIKTFGHSRFQSPLTDLDVQIKRFFSSTWLTSTWWCNNILGFHVWYCCGCLLLQCFWNQIQLRSFSSTKSSRLKSVYHQIEGFFGKYISKLKLVIGLHVPNSIVTFFPSKSQNSFGSNKIKFRGSVHRSRY